MMSKNLVSLLPPREARPEYMRDLEVLENEIAATQYGQRIRDLRIRDQVAASYPIVQPLGQSVEHEDEDFADRNDWDDFARWMRSEKLDDDSDDRNVIVTGDTATQVIVDAASRVVRREIERHREAFDQLGTDACELIVEIRVEVLRRRPISGT